jgi:phosphoglycerate kinase
MAHEEIAMAKKTVADLNVRGKRVLVRVDFNVPLDSDGKITDDRRIRGALPTIKTITDGGGRAICMSHLGRPKGEPNPKYTLAPAAKRLGELLGQTVPIAPDCIGPAVTEMVNSLQDGQCCLLENLRYHKPEEIKDKKARDDPSLREKKDEFARQIAAMGDMYVNDAFGTCHRDNASMLTVPQMMEGKPRAIGYLVKKELDFLGDAVAKPQRPFVVVLGGAKVSDKIGVIENLVDKCDRILIGGAMSYTFMAADGKAVGNSLTEPEQFDTARRLRQLAGDKLRLPTDSVAAARIEAGVSTEICGDAIGDGLMGLDIGPATIEAYGAELLAARTIVWNGPVGVFETPPFDAGTMAIAKVVAEATGKGAVSIIGGGDSAAAVDKAGLADQMTHISTGGGASLEFLEGKPFAAINIIDDA